MQLPIKVITFEITNNTVGGKANKMIALKMTDNWGNVLQLSCSENVENSDLKIAFIELNGNDEDQDIAARLTYSFDKKSELNSFITWLVGIKAHLPD